MTDTPHLSTLTAYARQPGNVWPGHRHWDAVMELYRRRLVRMIPHANGTARIEITDAGRRVVEQQP